MKSKDLKEDFVIYGFLNDENDLTFNSEDFIILILIDFHLFTNDSIFGYYYLKIFIFFVQSSRNRKEELF